MTASVACAVLVPSGDQADAQLGSQSRVNTSKAAFEVKRPGATLTAAGVATVAAKRSPGFAPLSAAGPPALISTPIITSSLRPSVEGVATVGPKAAAPVAATAKDQPDPGAEPATADQPGDAASDAATVVVDPLDSDEPTGLDVVVAGARASVDDEVAVLSATAIGPAPSTPPVADPVPAPGDTPVPEPERAVGPPPLPRPITGFWPSEAQWAALRRCESSGRYDIVDASGTYRGAYQFDRPTWRTVGGSGDPAAAPPDEQDYRARVLYARRGPQPWPVCGRFLR